MYLPVVTGFFASALTMALMIWVGYLFGKDILYPAFIYRCLFVSWFSGLAFYGWCGFAMKTYYRSIGLKYVQRLDETVVEPKEIPVSELKRIVSNENIRQMEDDDQNIPE